MSDTAFKAIESLSCMTELEETHVVEELSKVIQTVQWERSVSWMFAGDLSFHILTDSK